MPLSCGQLEKALRNLDQLSLHQCADMLPESLTDKFHYFYDEQYYAAVVEKILQHSSSFSQLSNEKKAILYLKILNTLINSHDVVRLKIFFEIFLKNPICSFEDPEKKVKVFEALNNVAHALCAYKSGEFDDAKKHFALAQLSVCDVSHPSTQNELNALIEKEYGLCCLGQHVHRVRKSLNGTVDGHVTISLNFLSKAKEHFKNASNLKKTGSTYLQAQYYILHCNTKLFCLLNGDDDAALRQEIIDGINDQNPIFFDHTFCGPTFSNLDYPLFLQYIADACLKLGDFCKAIEKLTLASLFCDQSGQKDIRNKIKAKLSQLERESNVSNNKGPSFFVAAQKVAVAQENDRPDGFYGIVPHQQSR